MDFDFTKIEPLIGDPKHVWQLSYDEFNCVGIVSDAFSVDRQDGDLVFEAAADEHDHAPIWRDGSYEIFELVEFEPIPTMVLSKDGAAIGFNMCGQLWIDEDYRGRGLSTPLILAVAARLGGPASPSELLGFSFAGAAAHESAWRAVVLWALEQGMCVPPAVVEDYLGRGGRPKRAQAEAGDAPA